MMKAHTAMRWKSKRIATYWFKPGTRLTTEEIDELRAVLFGATVEFIAEEPEAEENLEKAGALIAAEIDRLLRARQPAPERAEGE